MRLFGGKLEIRSPFHLTPKCRVRMYIGHEGGESSVVTVEAESEALIISALGNAARPARLRALARQIGGEGAFTTEPAPGEFRVGEAPDWDNELDGRE